MKPALELTSHPITKLAKDMPRMLLVSLCVLLISTSAFASVFGTNNLWPMENGKAVVPVCIVDGSSAEQSVPDWLPDSTPTWIQDIFAFFRIEKAPDFVVEANPSLGAVVDKVQRALANSWEKHGNVKFTEFGNCSSYSSSYREQMVGLYIHPEAPNHSYLGTVGKGRTTLSDHSIQFKPWGNDFNNCIKWDWNLPGYRYGWDCVEEYAIHEFGHLIGAEHEWVHPDVPGSCPKASPLSWSTSYYTFSNQDYDWDSIMTYWDGCSHQTGVRFGSTNLSYWDQKGVQLAYNHMKLDEWSMNYAKVTPSGNSSVYFYLPQQDSNVRSSGQRTGERKIWSGQTDYTRITVPVMGDDGIKRLVGLKGTKRCYHLFLAMENGVQRECGEVKFELDKTSDSFKALPEGQFYKGQFQVEARGWHDQEFESSFRVDVHFEKPMETIHLGSWSRNFSSLTPSGDSSVYFYVPEQFAVESSGQRVAGQNVWSAAPGATAISSLVTGFYGAPIVIDLLGYKKFGSRRLKMEDGVQRGYGQVKIEIDTNSSRFKNLPDISFYSGSFKIKAQGWHDQEYEKNILVWVSFFKFFGDVHYF